MVPASIRPHGACLACTSVDKMDECICMCRQFACELTFTNAATSTHQKHAANMTIQTTERAATVSCELKVTSD